MSVLPGRVKACAPVIVCSLIPQICDKSDWQHIFATSLALAPHIYMGKIVDGCTAVARANHLQ